MSDMCLSSSGVRDHQLRSDTDRQRKGFPLSTWPPNYGWWLGNCTFSSWIKSATKIPKRVGLSLLPSGTPRRMSTLLLLGIHGWRTQTLTVWNGSLRCFHILPTIFSLHSSERSLSQWMLGNVWICILGKSEASPWGWCGLGTWIKCGMTLVKECDH